MIKDESMNIESREEKHLMSPFIKQKMDTDAPYIVCVDYTSRPVSLYTSIQHFCFLSLDTDLKEFCRIELTRLSKI